jgi:type I restriction enzyme, S subunit
MLAIETPAAPVYPKVALRNVLSKSEETIDLEPTAQYKQITLKLWGKGVVQRNVVKGTELAGSRRYLARVNQFIVSRIDARHGASGIVPSELDGAVISNDFPSFNLDLSQILPQYLNWLSKTKQFIELCKTASEGTTNRVRLQEDLFLALEIPLPPLHEQRSIVARIEELSAKIERARELRRQAQEEAEICFEQSVIETFNTFANVDTLPLKQITLKIGSGSTPDGGRASYLESGIPLIRSMNVRMRNFSWDGIAYIDNFTHNKMKGTFVKPNDVLLNITGASLGRVACVPLDLKEANVNQHVSIVRPNERLKPRYLMYWLSQSNIQKYIWNEQKGATRQGFTKTQIEELEIPVPPLQEQEWIVAYLDELQGQVDRLRALQEQSAAEIEALLPAILDKAFKGEL